MSKKKTDAVSGLHGCGPKTVAKLNERGVHTYGDLLNFGDKIPGINIPQLKRRANEELKVHETRLKNHSWAGMVCHTVHRGNKMIRVTIGDLVIRPYRVALVVHWNLKNKKFKRLVSPTNLLATHVLWLNQDCVSDYSSEEDSPPPETIRPLPIFEIFENPEIPRLDSEKLDALHSLIKETRRLYKTVY